MKNLLYITYDGLLDPVTKSQVLPYLKELSRKGFSITALSFEKSEKIKEKNSIYIVKKELKEYGIKWLLLKYHKSPIIPATIFDILQGLFLSLRIIYTGKIRIIHTRGYITALIGLFLKYLSGKKLIFDKRGFWPEEKVDAGEWKKNGILYSVVKRLEKHLILKSDEIVVLTEAAKRYLCDRFPLASITVIPCCVDINLFRANASTDIRPEKARGKFIITYLGSLGTYYDLEAMISFLKIFKMKKSEVFFWIVTNCPYKEVHILIQKSQINSSDYAVSSLDYRKIPFVLTSSDVSIIFYRRRLSRIGCSPIKFAESLACGVPVIINSGIGDIEEIIKKEKVGVVVDYFSDTSFQKLSNELIHFLSEGAPLRSRCRKVAEKYFSLSDGVEQYRKVYQRLIHS